MPKKLKILHKDFVLRKMTPVEVLDHDGAWGGINGVTGELLYNEAPQKSETVDTLIHETLHGIVRMMDMRDFADKENEELIVSRFATGLTTVFRDNPEFLKAIQLMLKA